MRRAGTEVDLTTVEFDLLAALMRVAGRTVSREDLVRNVLGRDFLPAVRTAASTPTSAIYGESSARIRMEGSASREFVEPATCTPRPPSRGPSEKTVFNDLPLVLAHAYRRRPGPVLFSLPMRGLGARSLIRLSIHDLLVFTLAGGIFCYFISRYLTKPLNKLSQAAANIAEGRLDTRVDPSLKNRSDEIAGLARNFDRMAERIGGTDQPGSAPIARRCLHEVALSSIASHGRAHPAQARSRRRSR